MLDLFSGKNLNFKGIVKKTFDSLPKVVRKFGYWGFREIPLPIRYGKTFRETRSFLEASQWWSKSEIEEYQLKRLTHLIKHAYHNVPYYQQLFRKEGIKPQNIDDFDRLELIPPLTKNLLKENFPRLKAKNYPDYKFHFATTGGSTGEPTPFFHEVGVSDEVEWAFHWRYRNIIGVKFNNEYTILAGRNFNEKDSKGNTKWWYYDIPLRQLYLSSYHLKDPYLKWYFNIIKVKKNAVLSGYPSSLDILASYMKKNKLHFDNLIVTHTQSETLYQAQKLKMQEQFGTKVFDHYGHSERSVLIHQCEQNKLYHVIPEYGFTEIRDEKNRLIKQSGYRGEVIATGFMNYCYPLIRLRTQDLVDYSGEMCSCGRHFSTISKIEGRLQEFLITKSNRFVSMTAINMHTGEFKHVIQMQFYQEKRGEAILRIVKDKNYSDDDASKIMQYLSEKTGNDINLTLEYINEIPRTKSGKYKWIDQKIPIEY